MIHITTQYPRLSSFRTFIGNALFPPCCLLCNNMVDVATSICTPCFGNLRMISRPYCEQCGQPFAYAGDFIEICFTCQSDPPAYDAVRTIWGYDEHSAAIVKKLKYADHTRLAPYLARIMAGQGAELLEQATIIAPVPLHRKRIRHRRYNQSMLLAKHIRTHAVNIAPALTLLPDLLKRIHHRPPQTTLTHEERIQNVTDVFQVHPAHLLLIQGARIIMVDDVMTTGATVNACALTLKNAGASWVGVLTLAKRVME